MREQDRDPHFPEDEEEEVEVDLEAILKEKEGGAREDVDVEADPEVMTFTPDERVPFAPQEVDRDPALSSQIVARLQEELRSLRREMDKVKGQVKKGDDVATWTSGWPWQYYRRPMREGDSGSGWITTAPGGATPRGNRDTHAFSNYIQKGMKPITDYGPVPVPATTYTTPGQEFWPILENGGAKEFPCSQVVAYKWHLNPPIPGVVFPDYELHKEDVRRFLCDECDTDIYFMKDDLVASRASFTHLSRKHGYRREEANLALRAQGIRDLGRFAGEAEENVRKLALSREER